MNPNLPIDVPLVGGDTRPAMQIVIIYTEELKERLKHYMEKTGLDGQQLCNLAMEMGFCHLNLLIHNAETQIKVAAAAKAEAPSQALN